MSRLRAHNYAANPKSEHNFSLYAEWYDRPLFRGTRTMNKREKSRRDDWPADNAPRPYGDLAEKREGPLRPRCAFLAVLLD